MAVRPTHALQSAAWLPARSTYFLPLFSRRPASTCRSFSAVPLRMSTRAPPRRPSPPPQASHLLKTTARRSIFSYSVAASFIAKDHRFDPTTHVYHFHPYNRVQQNTQALKKTPPDQRPDSGQDAFFVSRVGDTGTVALGVADGVGGWMESGVDPADFSHGLCEYMAAAAFGHGKTPPGSTGAPPAQPTSSSSKPSSSSLQTPLQLSARRLMDIGYQAVRSDPEIEAGGSTAVVALLSPDGGLEVANLGDSGFIQLRRNAVYACSEPQTHAFNTPFQLSMIPPNILARMAAFGGAQLSDEPRDAEVTLHDLRHGDVLVFASDGVWDNLYNQDILKIVSRTMTATGAWQTGDSSGSGDSSGVVVAPLAVLKQLTSLEGGPLSAKSPVAAAGVSLQSLLATQITGAAKGASINTKLDGPFAKEVKRYYPHETWHGGKVDDICVVVAVVLEETDDLPVKSKL